MGKSERGADDGPHSKKRSKGGNREGELSKQAIEMDNAVVRDPVGGAIAPPSLVAAAGGGAQPASAGLPAAEGSHEADAPVAQHAQGGEEPTEASPAATAKAAAAAKRRAAGKAAPVRVPIAIEASEGVLLEEVRGLDPRLKAALEGGCCPELGWLPGRAACAALSGRTHAAWVHSLHGCTAAYASCPYHCF